jgi:hypothetical protein
MSFCGSYSTAFDRVSRPTAGSPDDARAVGHREEVLAEVPTAERVSGTDLLREQPYGRTMQLSHSEGDFPSLATVVRTRSKGVAAHLWTVEPTNARGATRPRS